MFDLKKEHKHKVLFGIIIFCYEFITARIYFLGMLFTWKPCRGDIVSSSEFIFFSFI